MLNLAQHLMGNPSEAQKTKSCNEFRMTAIGAFLIMPHFSKQKTHQILNHCSVINTHADIE
jgi:hypothetical protein